MSYGFLKIRGTSRKLPILSECKINRNGQSNKRGKYFVKKSFMSRKTIVKTKSGRPRLQTPPERIIKTMEYLMENEGKTALPPSYCHEK